MLTLYAVPQSPYCAKVRGALTLKQIPYIEQEPAGGSYQTTEYQETVVAGSVPAIQQGDWVLHDSQAILEYLQEHYPGPSLWAEDPRHRAMQRAILNYHDSKLEPTVRELVPLIADGDALAIGLVRDQFYDRLFRLERLLVDSDWIDVPSGSAGDWTIPCSISIGTDLLTYLGRPLELPGKLSGWMSMVSADPIVASERERVRSAIGVWLQIQTTRALEDDRNTAALN